MGPWYQKEQAREKEDGGDEWGSGCRTRTAFFTREGWVEPLCL